MTVKILHVGPLKNYFSYVINCLLWTTDTTIFTDIMKEEKDIEYKSRKWTSALINICRKSRPKSRPFLTTNTTFSAFCMAFFLNKHEKQTLKLYIGRSPSKNKSTIDLN